MDYLTNKTCQLSLFEIFYQKKDREAGKKLAYFYLQGIHSYYFLDRSEYASHHSDPKTTRKCFASEDFGKDVHEGNIICNELIKLGKENYE